MHLSGNLSVNPFGINEVFDLNHLTTSLGGDLNVGYAFSKKFMGLGSFGFRSEKNPGVTYDSFAAKAMRYKRNFTQLGAGYYTKIGGNEQAIFQLSALGGLGFNKITGPDDTNMVEDFYRYKTYSFTLQPAIILNAKKLTATFSSGISVVKYGGISTNYSTLKAQRYLVEDLDGQVYTFWQPAIGASRMISKKNDIRAQIQMGMLLLMSKKFIDTRSFNISIGASKTFHKKPA